MSAELDFTQSEATSETYDPEAVAVRSEQLFLGIFIILILVILE